MHPVNRLLKLPVVADATGLSVAEIRRAINANLLRAKKLTSARGTGARPRLRVLESDLAAFIANLPDVCTEPQVQPNRKRDRRPAIAARPEAGSAVAYY